MAKNNEMQSFVEFAAKRLKNPNATPEQIVESLTVENFPMEEIPGRHYNALVKFRHYAKAARVSTVRRYLLKD